MVELTKENFEAEVLKAEGKVFVDFYGDGCVPCAALMPFVHQYAETWRQDEVLRFEHHKGPQTGYRSEGYGSARHGYL